MSRANMQTGSNTRGGDSVTHYMEWWKEAAEDADRLRELLKRALLQLEIHAPRQAPLMDEIAKELADE